MGAEATAPTDRPGTLLAPAAIACAVLAGWFALPAAASATTVRPLVAVAAMLAAIVSLCAVVRCTRGRERYGWLLVLAGPLGAMLPYAGAPAGLLTGFGLLVLAGPDARRDRLRRLDAAIALTTASAIATAFLVPSVLDRLTGVKLVEGLAATVQAVVALACVLLVAYRHGPRARPDLWLVGAGFAAGTITGLPGLIMAGEDHASAWVPVRWWEVALPLAAVAVLAGALTRLHRPPAAGSRPAQGTPRGAALLGDALLAVAVVALAAPGEARPASVALVVVVLVLRHVRSALVEQENHRLLDEVRRGDQAVIGQQRASLSALAAALEARDGYTGRHGEETVALASAVAERLRLVPERRAEIETVALLHDVGKLGTPDAILHKPVGLTADEWAVMREHPVIGEGILRRIPGLDGVALAVRHEHEHFDGTGYPDGLAGDAIPLASRIVIVCDAFHAMTSDRPYRRRMSLHDATAELRRCAGTQFDPDVVEALLAAVAEDPAPRAPALAATVPAATAPPPPERDGASDADLPLLGRLFTIGFALSGSAGLALAVLDPSPLLSATPDRYGIVAAFVAAAVCAVTPWPRLHRLWALAPTLGGALLLAGACATTGGIESPYALLYVFLAAGAAALVGPGEAAAATAAVVAATWLPLVYDPGASASQAGVRAFLISATACVLAVTAQQSRRRRRALTERAYVLASEDPLTGLANRRAFEERSASHLARTRRDGSACALLYLDVDAFKQINDGAGHAAGDEALAGVARAADATRRADDLLARIGGDEFALLLPGTGRAEAGHAARRLQEAIGTVHTAAGPVRVSVGIAVAPADGADLDALLGAADERLREAKLARRVPA